MRKEDMMKLSEEDNKDLLKGKAAINYFFLFFFISNIVYPQTIINNFGITDIVETISGYKKLSIIDIDNDGNKDLFLYGNNGKNFAFNLNLPDSTFTAGFRKFFFYPIDDFEFFNRNEDDNDYYLFISRNKRLVGLVSFTQSHSLLLLNTIKYASYPSQIKIVDLNNDNNNEALIFGENYDGIELISNNGYLLETNNITRDAVIKDIDTLDINNDRKVDIVAIDLLNNSIKFFENTENLNYINEREIFFEQPVLSFQNTNFNNDEFIDLLVAKESGFEVLLGDSVQSFSRRLNFDYTFTPQNFLINNLTSDSLKDIVSINMLKNIVNVKSLDTNNSATNYFFNGISDMKIIEDSSGVSLALLSNKGKIKLLSSEEKWGESFSFSPGGKFKNENFYLNEEKNNFNFYSLDQLNNSVQITSLGIKGKFKSLASANFINTISNFFPASNNKIITGYSYKNRLIEVLIRNPKSKLFDKRQYHYTIYPIDKLLINNNTISVTSLADSNLFLQSFELDKNTYKPLDPVKIDSLTLCYDFNNNGLVYWSKNKDKIELNRFYENKKSNLLKIENKNLEIYESKIINKQSDNNLFPVITVVKEKKNKKIFYFNGKRLKKISFNKLNIENTDKSKLSFIKISKSGSFLILNNYLQGEIQFFKFDFENNKLNFYRSVKAKISENYFIRQFFGYYYLVFLDSENNFINFKLLDL